MSYVLRHNLTGVALQHLLKVFNEHFPGLVPETVYLFNKCYGEFGHYEPHFYCVSCCNYLGTREKSPMNCAVCHATFQADDNMKNGSFFLVLSLSSQLKDILENPNVTLSRQTTSEKDVLNDIQCGAEYIKCQLGEYDISLLWNYDGIPVFKSSKYQVWPIQCQVIELQPKDRKNNICVPCIWFGERKPIMSVLLTPFVNELCSLERDGLIWKNSRNVEQISKVYALICSSDSVARPLLRNSKQFNGQYGCDFCYHIGGGPYPYRRPEPLLRSETEHYDHAMAATVQLPVKGVKGPSEIMRLEKFQMINGFVPEYQHSVCLGVTRQLATLWLDSTNHNKEWYIGTKADIIDQELLNIKPPVEITRTPRSLKDRKYWKASEWRSFLLFYSLPILNGVLMKKYWNHLFLLVFALHILLQQQVKICEVSVAEIALKKFVIQFEMLYGIKNVSFNVHLLTHLAESVRNWGPLWATSTFSFESFNGTLLKYFSGTTHVPVQIVKTFLRWKSLRKRVEKCVVNTNDKLKELFSQIQNSNSVSCKAKNLTGNVTVFGPLHDTVCASHIFAVEELNGGIVCNCSSYSRFLIGETLYHAEGYSRLKKRNNSIAELKDGTLYKVLSFVSYETERNIASDTDEKNCCVVVQKLVKSRRPLCRDIQLNISSKFVYEVSETNYVYAVKTDSFKRKCVMVKLQDSTFVIPLPNNVERD
ncbi:hypothetical protein ABG768_021822 [Culter alburnus]|uniref:Transposase domain-containing protein n=1 Tax=Culter alburnus TaxID=194366 RepID=A0AAW2AT04_CULAL